MAVKKHTKHKIEIELSASVFKLATEAAARRKAIAVETLLAQIIGGVVCRGSIDRALAEFHSYAVATRAIDGAKFDAEACEGASRV